MSRGARTGWPLVGAIALLIAALLAAPIAAPIAAGGAHAVSRVVVGHRPDAGADAGDDGATGSDPSPRPAALADRPALRSIPDAVLHGHAANVYLQILAAARLDADAAADLVVGELPTGVRGDERTESNVLLGRTDWPARAGTESLGLRKIAEPVLNNRDRFAFLGSGDVDGDGRDDLVTVTVRQPGDRAQSVRLGLHWSPAAWPGRPSFTSADVTLDVPSKTVPDAAAVADVDGDALADVVFTTPAGIDIVRGRRPWPGTVAFEPPDVHIAPGPAAVRVGDVTGDGRADLWLTFDAVDFAGAGANVALDAALVAGRAAWPAAVDAAAEADIRLGTGSHDLSGAIVPDVTGDGRHDVLRIDRAASALEVYRGGGDIAARLNGRSFDWAVAGISDTYGVQALDLSGDGVAELLVDRHAVVVGGAGRRGTVDIAAGTYDAEWPGIGGGAVWSADVDGRRGADVLVADSAASVQGRRGAGTISIYLSPLWTANAATPAVPSATPHGSPSPIVASPSPAGTGSAPASTRTPTSHTATPPGDAAGRLWLPIGWTGR